MITDEQYQQATAEGRHVRFRFSGEVIGDLFTAGKTSRFTVLEGVPPGAVLAAVEAIEIGPGSGNVFDLIYVHPDLPARAEGADIPVRGVIAESIPAG